MDTLPRTRASPEPMGHHRGVKPGRPPEFCATLKLLVALVVRRRKVSPSSKVSKQLARSFRLTSDEPSPASPLGQQRRVEIVERSPATAGPGGCALENFFHL